MPTDTIFSIKILKYKKKPQAGVRLRQIKRCFLKIVEKLLTN
jgi:hypothetical protein